MTNSAIQAMSIVEWQIKNVPLTWTPVWKEFQTDQTDIQGQFSSFSLTLHLGEKFELEYQFLILNTFPNQ